MSKRPLTHARLDFERLFREYMENLNVNLRGFKAAAEHDFLDAWVPSEDPTESLIELVQLGRDANLASIAISVGQATFDKLDVTRIEKAVGAFRRTTSSDQSVLEFELAPAAELDIHPCYRQRLGDVLKRVTHEGSLAADDKHELISATRDGVTLTALVARARHTVARAVFQGAATPVQRGLMESLCAIMESTPLQECADHALIAVEHALRDPSLSPPVAGLVTPENADPAFALPQSLVRAILDEYRSRTGRTETANFYDHPISERWARTSTQERTASLQRALEAQGMTGQVELVGMDGPKRVVVRFPNDLSSAAKQALLVRLEGALRQTVEPTLHVVAQVKADVNILRLPEKKQPT